MKVLHVLAELNRSGAERMLACSFPGWRAAGIEPIVVGLGDDHPFAAGLASVGYEVMLAPKVRSVDGLAGLRRTIRATTPQVVHIHSESCFDAVAMIAALTPGVEGIVRTVHSSFSFGGFLRRRRTVRAALARRLGVVWVACSPEVAETERTRSSNRMRVVENWIDVDTIVQEANPEAGRRVRGELGIEPHAAVLALIGNCGGAKNHELVPAALAGVETPVHVVHVGHARYQPEAEQDAWQRFPDRHTVHHLGGRADVPALLAASDLVLVPSLYEGMPLVPAEALCAGVPVLAADTLGLQWLAELPSASLVALDHRAWTASITEALARGRDAAACNTAAAVARARFRPERGVSEYLDAYEAARGRLLPGLATRRWAARPAAGER